MPVFEKECCGSICRIVTTDGLTPQWGVYAETEVRRQVPASPDERREGGEVTVRERVFVPTIVTVTWAKAHPGWEDVEWEVEHQAKAWEKAQGPLPDGVSVYKGL